MYKLNDIFYNDETYSNRAEFCSKNGYVIQEIEADENGRRFQITEPPKPTEKDLAQFELARLTQWFEEYDKQVIQYQRSVRLGVEFDKNIAELDNQAVINANRIKELRLLIQ